jgi:hypothetical protein
MLYTRLTNSMEQLLREVAQLVMKFHTFYRSQRSSLQCPQKPVNGPHPEPDESNPHIHILFP